MPQKFNCLSMNEYLSIKTRFTRIANNSLLHGISRKKLFFDWFSASISFDVSFHLHEMCTEWCVRSCVPLFLSGTHSLFLSRCVCVCVSVCRYMRVCDCACERFRNTDGWGYVCAWFILTLCVFVCIFLFELLYLSFLARSLIIVQ